MSRARTLSIFAVVCMICVVAWGAMAAHTPPPASVTLPGSFQEELGCPGDWQPDCANTDLTFDADDGVWQATFNIPAGAWEYKAALNHDWTENYGANAQQGGANIGLSLVAATDVKFYYDHETHWITDDVNSVIPVVAGSFQDEIGCPGDWDPACLRSWLQDPDGDGIFVFVTDLIPQGDYECKVTIGEDWTENYGAGGVAGGPNIPFTVTNGFTDVVFEFDYATKILTITELSVGPQPDFVTVAGSLQDELGCPGDWQPDCTGTDLAFDVDDLVWQGTFSVPAGDYEYKGALDHSWNENYGANAQLNGPNIGLSLAAPTDVKFYYDHETHWVTDNVNSVIAVVAGSFQDEIGCPGDWQPWSLRSWLQDPDGDGIYQLRVTLPGGNYECKVAHDEDWAENYGAGGVPNGPNMPFTVPGAGGEVFFTYDPVTHLLDISAGPADRPPVAQCQAVTKTAGDNCTADVAPEEVDDGSYDPEGGAVTLELSPIGPYPVGINPVELIVTDAGGQTDTCTTSITVTDPTSPGLTVELDGEILWPPNHEMIEVCATVTLDGGCSGTGDLTWALVSVTSDEPDDAPGGGDGHTLGDIEILGAGGGGVCVRLRAERQGNGDGRVYTLRFILADSGAPVETVEVSVTVPHDRSRVGSGTNRYDTDDMGDGYGQESTVEVFTVTGRLIRVFTGRDLAALPRYGWDGRDLSGRAMPTGVYFYRISVGDTRQVKKVLLTR